MRVSNAFRHSSVSGHGAGDPNLVAGRRVSNAFRHSSVSGRTPALREFYEKIACLQCLSAFVRFGTPPRRRLARRRRRVSPMPFGIRPFRDLAQGEQSESCGMCLQCLSAFVRFGTQGGKSCSDCTAVLSPMPFGIRPFRDLFQSCVSLINQGESPMPFGIRPFRDRCAAGCLISPEEYVSNAFRHSSVSGRFDCLHPYVADHASLQCLSAFVRFGTSLRPTTTW